MCSGAFVHATEHMISIIAKLDVEGYTDMSEGECALVCQDIAPPAEGVTDRKSVV